MIQMKKYLLIIAGIMVFTSCKKFLDVNKNVDSPTVVPVSTLITNSEQQLGAMLGMGENTVGGLSQILAVYMHQMTTREEEDQYGANGFNYWIANTWTASYGGALNNLDVVIAQATTDDNLQYRGIAKIIKAYTYSQLVDVFGDVPFSEFNRFKEGIKQPKFDKDSAIYRQIFTLLDEGIADLNNTTAANPSKPGGDDVIYAGSTTKWVKAANTIKLKLYTQLRKVRDVSAEVNALLANPSTLISATDESFVLPYGPMGATDDRNPGFSDYTASQRSNQVSPWFYGILKGYNTGIYTGIADPRIKYYIYNQKKATSAADNATEYRDGAFISIYFGSVGPDRDRSNQNSVSLFGIYPVGGRYDDGAGGTASATSGTGAAPYRFITYADRLFLQAELANAGVISGDDSVLLRSAITESFKQIDWVVTSFVKPTQTVPAISGTAAQTTYITAVLDNFKANSAARRLEHIMTQKWLSSVGSSVDQYTDYRRTGYPVLFDPNNATMAPGGFVQPPINGDPARPGAQPKVPVLCSTPYPLSLPWPQAELEQNSNAPAQKTPSTYKIFWMP